MAHILLKCTELKLFQNLNLPVGTTIYEEDSQGDSNKNYIVSETGWQVTCDHKEKKRPFSKEKLKEFKSSLTNKRCLEYLTDPEGSRSTS